MDHLGRQASGETEHFANALHDEGMPLTAKHDDQVTRRGHSSPPESEDEGEPPTESRDKSEDEVRRSRRARRQTAKAAEAVCRKQKRGKGNEKKRPRRDRRALEKARVESQLLDD